VYDSSRHNHGSGDNVCTIRTCAQLPPGAAYRMCRPSPTRSGWRGVCTAYAQQTEEDTYVSPTSRQVVWCPPPSHGGNKQADLNYHCIHTTTAREACCREAAKVEVRLVDLQANPKSISHQPKHNSRVLHSSSPVSCWTPGRAVTHSLGYYRTFRLWCAMLVGGREQGQEGLHDRLGLFAWHEMASPSNDVPCRSWRKHRHVPLRALRA